jgi:hypothetical protein
MPVMWTGALSIEERNDSFHVENEYAFWLLRLATCRGSLDLGDVCRVKYDILKDFHFRIPRVLIIGLERQFNWNYVVEYLNMLHNVPIRLQKKLLILMQFYQIVMQFPIIWIFVTQMQMQA